MIIAHHRQPTSSDNKINQTHPIFISNKMLNFDYYFIHNGVLSNDGELKEKHYKMGFKYSTEYAKEGYYQGSPTTVKFNDSEALGVEIALFIEEKQTVVDTNNTAAFMALQVNKKTHKAEKVFFGRSGGGSCLNLAKIKGNIKISSEGEGEEVLAETLWSFDPKDAKMKLTSRAMEFKQTEKPAIETPYHRHIHQNPLPTNLAITKTTPDNVPPTKDKAEVIEYKERKWNEAKTDESVSETDYEAEDLEEIFAGKNYQAETIEAFKETIKEDESEMIEASLDVALDEQVEKINKMMQTFQKTIMQRKIDPKERGFYLSQTYIVLKSIEALADLAEEDYIEKLIQEEIKVEEEKNLYDVQHMGYRASKSRVHNYKTGEYDEKVGDIDYDNFGY